MLCCFWCNYIAYWTLVPTNSITLKMQCMIKWHVAIKLKTQLQLIVFLGSTWPAASSTGSVRTTPATSPRTTCGTRQTGDDPVVGKMLRGRTRANRWKASEIFQLNCHIWKEILVWIIKCSGNIFVQKKHLENKVLSL